MEKEKTLFDAVHNLTHTENGMRSFKSTLNSCVDFFFAVGGSRGKNVCNQFLDAYAENKDLAMRMLLWLRDVREGAGERQIFRELINTVPLTETFISKIPELGRWDDLLSLINTDYKPFVIELIRKALADGTSLCAKWMPRKGLIAKKIRESLKLSPKAYRKLLVRLTQVVETPMCANDWTEIEYNKVPSLASARYQKAFQRHDPDGYANYIERLEAGKTTINAGAVYPYDIVKSIEHGNDKVANQQWLALPNWIREDTSFLPIVDVSGSMDNFIGNSNITALEVAISLGLYVAERCRGIFKNQLITFSESPAMCCVQGTLPERLQKVRNMNWSMNTNIEKVFNIILEAAVYHKLAEDQMPEMIIIFSDMQFDACVKGYSALSMIDAKYKTAGYIRPKIVFWNLCNRAGNIPATVDSCGTALVSGFSPSLMKSILACEDFTPIGVMRKTICIDRYNWK
jgi:hypothetical protein